VNNDIDAVTAYIDAFERGDVDAFISAFGADGTYQDPSTQRAIPVSEMKVYFDSRFGVLPIPVCTTASRRPVGESRSAGVSSSNILRGRPRVAPCDARGALPE
jgi:hypothetical protein